MLNLVFYNLNLNVEKLQLLLIVVLPGLFIWKFGKGDILNLKNETLNQANASYGRLVFVGVNGVITRLKIAN
jgi:hypothetical protein